MRNLLVCLLFVFFVCAPLNAAPPQKGSVVEPSLGDKNMNYQIPTSCGSYSRPLVVAGMIGNAPFGWVEKDSRRGNMESKGLGRIVLDKIAKQLKLYYRTTAFMSQEEAILALRKGKIDMLLSVYHKSDLGKEVDVIYPAYFTNIFNVYFKKGKELPVKSYEDLVGLKGVVRKEELIYPLIYQRLPEGVDLEVVLSASVAFEKLMNDEVDYILSSPYALEGELRRYKMQNDIVSDGEILGSATLFFALSKNSPCFKLKDTLSNALRANNFTQQTLNDDIQKLIDDWGERFRSDEVLIKTKNNTLKQYNRDEESDDSQKKEDSDKTKQS